MSVQYVWLQFLDDAICFVRCRCVAQSDMALHGNAMKAEHELWP